MTVEPVQQSQPSQPVRVLSFFIVLLTVLVLLILLIPPPPMVKVCGCLPGQRNLYLGELSQLGERPKLARTKRLPRRIRRIDDDESEQGRCSSIITRCPIALLPFNPVCIRQPDWLSGCSSNSMASYVTTCIRPFDAMSSMKYEGKGHEERRIRVWSERFMGGWLA